MGFVQKLLYLPDPALLFYLFATMLQQPVYQQYAYMRFSEEKGLVYNYSQTTSTCGQDSVNNSQHEIRKEVQEMSARYNIAFGFALTIPSVIACLFYGALSDKIGRKPILILCILGGIFDASLAVLITHFNWSVPILYIAALLNGLAGGYTNFTMASFAYVADTTKKENLSVRLSVLQCIIFMGMMSSVFTSGVFVHEIGFFYTIVLSLSFKIISLLWVILILKESLGYNTNLDETKQIKKESNFEELKNIHKQPLIMWRTFVKPRPNRAVLFVCFFINMFDYCFTVGIFSVLNLYFMNTPFCWPPLDIGYYEGTSLLCIGVGTAIGVKIGLKFLSESTLSGMSLIICAGYFFVLVFAKTNRIAYAALALKSLSGLPSPIFRSIMSRMVGEDEQGSVFSLVSSSQMLIIFLANFFFNFSYTKLNKMDKPNLFWYIPTGAMAIPLLLVILYWYLQQKHIKYLDCERSKEYMSPDCGKDNPARDSINSNDEKSDDEAASLLYTNHVRS